MLGQQNQPLPIKSPIFGPAYMSRSGRLADQQAINVYPEIVETHTGKEIGALYGAPGLTSLLTIGTGPIREMHIATLSSGATGTSLIPQQLLYVVSGNGLYSVDQNFNVTMISATGIGGPGGYLYSKGTVVPGFSIANLPFTPTNSDTFVTMEDNGVDLAIFVGMSIVQNDGFGLINQPGTYNLFQSNEVDFTNWPTLQFAQASVEPDPIVKMISTRNEIFVMKQRNTEVWNNNGTPNFTFGREVGPHMEVGCLAPGSVRRSGETFFMLAQNAQGEGIVVKLIQYSYQRISTHAIERQIQAWPNPSDAIGYCYQQEGHQFYVLSSPSGDQTWVYDDTVSQMAGVPMWHQRAAYSSTDGLPHRHWGNCAASFAGLSLVGDYRNGNIYYYNLNTFDDNGNTRAWLRSWRAIQQPPTGRLLRFNYLMIDMETGGIGTTNLPLNSSPPNVALRWSDDGGYTWGPQLIQSCGPVGQTARRVKFNRLGSLRMAKGYDRIFELSSADKFPVALVGATFE